MSGYGSSSDNKETIHLVDEKHEIDWKPKRRNRARNRKALLVVCLAIVVVALIVAAVVVGTTVGSRSSGSTADGPWLNVRLPSNIQPLTYDLSLSVDLGKFTVQGIVTIAALVQAATPYIIVHALDMDISSATVSTGTVSERFFFSENQFYVIAMNEALPAGKAITIKLNFNYNLTSGLSGFYRSSYNTISGTTAYLATTQFEPTDARRAFPCFDEPAFKANFTIHVTHDCHYTAVSNMPVSSISGDPTCAAGNSVTTNFQTSVKMSTYLVAFIVSQFQYINGSTGGSSPVKVRVWSNPDVLNKTSLALKVGVESLNFYNSYYGIPYPLEKQDFFAIPDFSAGAMENWGLITYRETALLYDNTTGPVSSKQRVAVVIAHELAHQWFGDLVTMKWWDGLWLNEGFATFMEYLGVNNSFPEWNLLDQFFTDVNQVAMLQDGLNETHPIIQAASTPAEINALFDSISYEKGGSVIRMLRDWMGEENFRQGIQLYLRTYAYQNAATDMLWQSLQQYSTSNIASIMDTWTKQMGYPVVTVKRTSPTTASVSQERFFFLKPNGTTIAPSPYNYIWKIPFKYTTSPSGNIASVLIETTATIALDPSQTWIKANVQQMGFYRVNYDLDNWGNLTAYLKTNNWKLLSALDRAGLVDDAFALSSAGLLSTTIAFNLSTYLLQETEYVPWVAALTWINIFADRLSLTPIYGQYQRYVLSLLVSVSNQYTLYNSSGSLTDVQNLLRASVLGAAFRYGNTAVTQAAAVLFQYWKNSNTILDPNIKAVVYLAGIALGTEDDWNFMWNKFLAETDPYEKRLYINALAQSTQPWILNRYLAYSLSDNVRSQDTLSLIQAVSSTVNGRYLAWYFVRDNWSVLLSRYGTGSFSLTNLIRVVTKAFSTELELNEVEVFFGTNPDAGSGTRAVLQAIESIKANIQWVNNNQNGLGTWLNWWNTH